MQLREVGGPALGEVAVRLGGGADGDGGDLHEVRVRGLFAAQDDDGHAGAQHRLEAVVPRAPGSEDPDDDEVGPGEQVREVGLHVDA